MIPMRGLKRMCIGFETPAYRFKLFSNTIQTRSKPLLNFGKISGIFYITVVRGELLLLSVLI